MALAIKCRSWGQSPFPSCLLSSCYTPMGSLCPGPFHLGPLTTSHTDVPQSSYFTACLPVSPSPLLLPSAWNDCLPPPHSCHLAIAPSSLINLSSSISSSASYWITPPHCPDEIQVHFPVGIPFLVPKCVFLSLHLTHFLHFCIHSTRALRSQRHLLSHPWDIVQYLAPY